MPHVSVLAGETLPAKTNFQSVHRFATGNEENASCQNPYSVERSAALTRINYVARAVDHTQQRCRVRLEAASFQGSTSLSTQIVPETPATDFRQRQVPATVTRARDFSGTTFVAEPDRNSQQQDSPQWHTAC